MRTRARVPGSSPEPGWTMAQHEAAAAAYWAAYRRHNGGSTSARPGLTTVQHILHLLISVFTFGLWIPVWIYLANRTERTVTPADPAAPMPVWPPPDPSAWGA
jgi:hypothetical protein